MTYAMRAGACIRFVHRLRMLASRLKHRAIHRPPLISAVSPVLLTPPRCRLSGSCRLTPVSPLRSAHRHPLSCTSALVSDPGGSRMPGHLSAYTHWPPYGSTSEASHGWKLSRLNCTALVLAVNGCLAALALRTACGWLSRYARLVPASRLTTHDSLPAAWLQALPRGILTRWDAL